MGGKKGGQVFRGRNGKTLKHGPHHFQMEIEDLCKRRDRGNAANACLKLTLGTVKRMALHRQEVDRVRST